MIAVESSTFITIIAIVAGGGGLVGGIIALLKLRPEAGQITVTAAQGAVIVQTGVIENLHRENERLQKRIKDLETSAESVNTLLRENRDLKERNAHLEDRVDALEAEVDRLTKKGTV